MQGFRTLEAHIGAGQMQPVTMVAELNPNTLWADIDTLTAEISELDGVASVQSASQPLTAGHEITVDLTRVDRQLGTLAIMTTPSETAPTPEQIEIMTALFTDLPAYLAIVAENNPAIVESEAYESLLNTIANGEFSPTIAADLQTLAGVAQDAYLPLNQLPAGVAAVFGGEVVQGLVGSFVNESAGVARFEIILADNPYSAAAMDTVVDLKDMVAGVADGDSAALGATAINTDLRKLSLAI